VRFTFQPRHELINAAVKIFQATLLGILLVVFGTNASAQTKEEIPKAEPLNVLVDQFTFTRPVKWKWVPNSEASTAAARFLISSNSRENPTDVRFYISEKPPEETMATWKGFFVGDSDTQYDLRKEMIGKYETTWFSMTGIHKSKSKSTIISKFVGVIIPIENHYLLIRLYGQKTPVAEATKDFQRMIQVALTEE
jgi:hypothetical protein